MFSLYSRLAAKVNTTAHCGMGGWLISPLAQKEASCHYKHTQLAVKKNRNWSALNVTDRSVQSDLGNIRCPAKGKCYKYETATKIQNKMNQNWHYGGLVPQYITANRYVCFCRKFFVEIHSLGKIKLKLRVFFHTITWKHEREKCLSSAATTLNK